MLEQQQPDHEAGLDPRPAVLAVERRDLVIDPVLIDLAGEQNQFVFMLMSWSSLARNRSFDPVVLCFFGRIVPSDIMVRPEKESTNQIAFSSFQPPIPAISDDAPAEKTDYRSIA